MADEMNFWDDEMINDRLQPTEATLLPMLSLEEAGLEELQTRCQPSHGYQNVPEYVIWWSDGDDSRWEMN